jgi:hypothetical protein
MCPKLVISYTSDMDKTGCRRKRESESERELSMYIGYSVFHENRNKDAVLFLWTQRNYIQACRKAVLVVPQSRNTSVAD